MSSPTKTFMFNIGSFSLAQPVEEFLRSKGAILIDFGSMAYLNSESMPSILSGLVENSAKANSDLAQLKAELDKSALERDKLTAGNARLESQLGSHASEISLLKEKETSAIKLVEALKAENSRLQISLKSASAQQGDQKLKQSYDILQREFQALKSQSVEAITSLKVLEDENEELRQELETLKNQTKPVPAPKAA